MIANSAFMPCQFPSFNPWSVQIAMLPLRRDYPDDVRATDPNKRAWAIATAKKRTSDTRKKIRATLRKHGQMTADTLSQLMGHSTRANGNLYRQLDLMAEDGAIIKRRSSRNIVTWELAPC